MKVSVTQTGGPLGVPMRTALDSADLSEADAADLAARAGAAVRAEAPPGASAERRFPAQLAYTVRVEPDDGPAVQSSYLEGAMPAEVSGLVRWVQDHPSSSGGA